jgi:hypothetical protein
LSDSLRERKAGKRVQRDDSGTKRRVKGREGKEQKKQTARFAAGGHGVTAAQDAGMQLRARGDDDGGWGESNGEGEKKIDSRVESRVFSWALQFERNSSW